MIFGRSIFQYNEMLSEMYKMGWKSFLLYLLGDLLPEPGFVLVSLDRFPQLALVPLDSLHSLVVGLR